MTHTDKHLSTSNKKVHLHTQVMQGYHTHTSLVHKASYAWKNRHQVEAVTNFFTLLPSVDVSKHLSCHIPTLQTHFLLGPSLKEHLSIFFFYDSHG